MTRPHTLAEVARRHNAGEDFSLLLREFLDEFYSGVRRGEAAACIADEPECLPDLQEHALLGGRIHHPSFYRSVESIPFIIKNDGMNIYLMILIIA